MNNFGLLMEVLELLELFPPFRNLEELKYFKESCLLDPDHESSLSVLSPYLSYFTSFHNSPSEE